MKSNQKDACINLAKEISNIIDLSIDVEYRENNVLIDEVSYTGDLASFRFGQKPYPFNLLKNEEQNKNYIAVEFMEFDGQVKDKLKFEEIEDLLNELKDSSLAIKLKIAMRILENKMFSVEQPYLSTDKSRLFINFKKEYFTVKFNIIADFKQ